MNAVINHYPLPLQGRPERRHLYVWIKEEEKYVAEKYDDHRNEHDQKMAEDFDWWIDYIFRYLSAAKSFFDEARTEENSTHRRRLEMLGQQAMAKGAMTLKGGVESAIRVFGPMPKPGMSSGEILRWFDPVFHAATHEEQ